MTDSAQILIVEDNLADVGLVREGFTALESHVELHLCRDGAEALAFLRREGEFSEAPRPDLILLDLNIPKKNGREVLAAVKGDENLATIPIVVLSTSAAETDVEDCYRLHANAYVVKPLRLDEFIEAMTTVGHFWLGCATLHGPPGRAESLRRKQRATKAIERSSAPGDEADAADEADVATVAAEGAGQDERQTASKGNGKPNGEIPDVIVVEDDRVAVEMLEYAFTNAGYSVTSFMDGSTALAGLLELETGSRKPVVLLDVDLPGTDGFKILREINAARPDAYQIVMCTMHKSEASQVLGFKSGAVDYLVKPLRFPVVMAKVRRLLDG